MKKISLTLTFILFASLVFADRKTDLSEHGKDLMRASFPARYNFSKVYKKDWEKSTYAEREEFLKNWHKELVEQDRLSKEQAIRELNARKDLQRKQQAQRKEEHNKKKNEIKQVKQEKRIYDERAQKFNEKVKQQQKDLQRLMKTKKK